MTDQELGAALRAWRERVRPGDVGLPAGPRRRTPGLRRDEVAQLAGVSVEYVVRLEQGRSRHPTRQVLDALARALRLSGAEHGHLLRLAGATPVADGCVPRYLPPSVHRLLDHLSDTSVAVFDASWTMITCSPMWEALIGRVPDHPWRERNIIWRSFTRDEQGPVVRTDEEKRAFAASCVGDLRLAADRYPNDTELAGMVADLRRRSPEFASLWDAHAVGPHVTEHKTISHPEVGLVTVDCDVLNVAGHDLRIVVHSAAPGTPDADALALLAVLGSQRVGSAHA